MPINRNIITDRDAAVVNDPDKPNPLALAANPPAMAAQGNATADDYMTKLLKYLPPEVVGFYLFVSTLITQNEAVGSTLRSGWLLGLLLFSVIAACFYDWLVLKVERPLQIAMTGIGFVVYVFAIGGWFTTTTWYQVWYGSVALAVFAIAIAMVPVPALKTAPAVDAAAAAADPAGAEPAAAGAGAPPAVPPGG